VLTRLGSVLAQEGRVAAAEDALREAYAINLEVFGRTSPEVAGSLNVLAVTVAMNLPRLQEAIQLYHDAFEIRERLAGKPALALEARPATIAGAQPTAGDGAKSSDSVPPATLAVMLARPGSLAEVEAVLRDAQHYATMNYGKESWEEAFFLALSAWILLEERKFDEAEQVARQCLAIRNKLRPDDWSTHHARHIVGAALAGQDKFKEAEPLLLEGYNGMKARIGSMPEFHLPRLGEAVERITRFYLRLDRQSEVAKWRAEFAGLSPEAKAVLLSTPVK
jgi:tetratricopeptide (TPR) repeat protein